MVVSVSSFAEFEVCENVDNEMASIATRRSVLARLRASLLSQPRDAADAAVRSAVADAAIVAEAIRKEKRALPPPRRPQGAAQAPAAAPPTLGWGGVLDATSGTSAAEAPAAAATPTKKKPARRRRRGSVSRE